MIQKKPITEEQALKKMGNFCAKTEHCSSEIMDKMYKMGLSEEAKVRILGKLFIMDTSMTNVILRLL